MKSYTPIILASLLSLFSVNSHAEDSVYAGAAIGVSNYEYEDIDAAAATKLFIGYKMDNNFALEATLYDSGDADITSLSGFELNTDGINLTAFYRLPTAGSDLTAMVGLGIYSFDTTVKTNSGSVSEDGTGLSVSAGLEYALTENVALRGDIDFFVGVKDFADNESLDSVHIGILYNF